MDEQRRKFFEEGSRLIDSVNRLMLFIALLVFYFLITPVLYDIQKSTQKTAKSTEHYSETLEAIRKGMSPESWQKVEQPLKGVGQHKSKLTQ